MNLLAFDATGDRLTLALEAGGRTRARRAPAGRDADEILPAEIERLLRSAGLALRDVDALVAPTGPGRFTGIRVGLTFAGVAAGALGKRAVGVSWLEAAAWRSSPEPGALLAVVPGWKGEFFFQSFRRDEGGIAPAGPPRWSDPAGFRAAASGEAAGARLVGPAAREAIALLGGRKPRGAGPRGGYGEAGLDGPALAEAEERPLEAADLLAPARRRLHAGSDEPLEPLYIKPAHYER